MKVSVADLFAPGRVETMRQIRIVTRAAEEFETHRHRRRYRIRRCRGRAGKLVSFIQSNFMGFGSGVVEPETAIILQNRGHLFSLDENHPNCIGPHKRCVHTLMPGMIFEEWQALRRARIEGRTRSAAGSGADYFQSHRFWHDAAGSDSAPRFNHIGGTK